MKLVRAHKIQDSMSSRACDMAYISRKETEGSLVTKEGNHGKDEKHQQIEGAARMRETNITDKRHSSQQWCLQCSCGHEKQTYFLVGGRGTHLSYLMWRKKEADPEDTDKLEPS